MKLSEKKGGDFEPHPETDGLVKAVIVDRTPLKKVQSEYGEREVFRLVYETEVTGPDGKRLCIWSRPYTPSLNEKANLRKDLKKLLGRDLTQAELGEFDIDGIIGLGIRLMVGHEEGKDGKTYAVITVLSPDKDKHLKPSGNYVRVQDRENSNSAGGAGGESSSYRKAPQDEEAGREDWQKTKVHVGKHSGVDLGDLDAEAVQSLIDKWLPKHKENAKPKADDKRLAASLEVVAELLGQASAPVVEDEY